MAGFTIIDEAQKAPALFPAIKQEVDRHRQPGRYLLTGSANVLMLPTISESLAGRMEIVTLQPLSQGELAGDKERFIDAIFAPHLPAALAPAQENASLEARVLAGGYPEALRRETDRRTAWFSAYITTLLQRDVRDMANIEGLTDMPRLLRLIAARTGGLLNIAELSRTSGIAHSTLRRYLTLLEATFLLQPLPAWSSNLGKRLVKAPKLYLLDSGLASHLTGYTNRQRTADAALFGGLLENFVLAELRKQAGWAKTRVAFFHFRTVAGREVDILMEAADGSLIGIEIKAAATVTNKDFTGLRALAEASGKRFIRGIVLYSGQEIVPFGLNLAALPIESLWRMK
jgi:predicted AAA+ superfamily ATPase